MECDDDNDNALPLIRVLKFDDMPYKLLSNRISHLTFFTALEFRQLKLREVHDFDQIYTISLFWELILNISLLVCNLFYFVKNILSNYSDKDFLFNLYYIISLPFSPFVSPSIPQ